MGDHRHTLPLMTWSGTCWGCGQFVELDTDPASPTRGQALTSQEQQVVRANPLGQQPGTGEEP